MNKLPIVGMNWRPGARELLDRADAGTQLTLKREPDNKYDKNAVQVWLGEHNVGYLPRTHSYLVAPRLDSGMAFDSKLSFSRNSHYPMIDMEQIDEEKRDATA